VEEEVVDIAFDRCRREGFCHPLIDDHDTRRRLAEVSGEAWLKSKAYTGCRDDASDGSG